LFTAGNITTNERLKIDANGSELSGVSGDGENDELKEVEEDMELLELKDVVDSDNVLFELKTKELVSSPRSTSRNRRYTLRPQKKPENTECEKSNNRKKSTPLPKHGCLETIFESPLFKNGAVTLIGKAKLKRYLSFDSFVSKAKLRHRKLKLKRLSKGKRKKNSRKVSIEEVKRKLKCLEDDEWMDMQE
jgi:hypothetical protein